MTNQNIANSKIKLENNISIEISFTKDMLNRKINQVEIGFEKNISKEIDIIKSVLNKNIDTKMTLSNWDIDHNHKIDSNFLEYNRSNIFNYKNAQIYNLQALAWGTNTKAYGYSSTSFGLETIADQEFQLSIGKYNEKSQINSIFSIGNGDDRENRHDIFQVTDTEV